MKNVTEKPLEYWEEWFQKYRSDEITILVLESIRVLLRNGSMTAEDVHHIPVKNPSVRGELMRTLNRMGLVTKMAFEQGTTKASHGHAMFKWGLVDAAKAKQLQSKFALIVLPKNQYKQEPKQLELL